jgi:hypothetical protein
MAENLLRIGLGFSHDKTQYEQIKKKYTSNTKLDIEQKDLTWISQRITSDRIVTAWQECIKTKFGDQRGVTSFVTNDQSKELFLQINWIPRSKYEPARVKITRVTMSSNLKRSGKAEIIDGSWIETYTGLTQKIIRKDSAAASITINVQGLKPVTVQLKKISRPPVKPVMQDQWTKADETGKLYSQTFVITTQQCWDCRHGGIRKDGVLSIDDAEGRIYDVKYQCQGAECGWNYSGCAGGGYGICGKILNDRRYQWFREWDGGVTYDIYTLYYEKKRPVCVSNCQ